MIATHPHLKFPGLTNPHAQDYQPYQLAPDRSSKSGQSLIRPCAVSTRAQMEPPRPLEPRAHDRTPSLQETRRHDIFNSTPRPMNQQPLPGVRDILSPPLQGYNSHEAWRATPQHYHIETQYQQPPTYQPRPEQYIPQRIELPILETRHQPVGLAPSPFGTSQSESRDYIDSRPRQLSNSSYARDSVASPFTPSHDETAPRSTTYERSGSIFTPTTADSSRRYVGIRDFPEGQFHVYEDGHRLPTHVDGEQVNPQWGLTKANKPRKRLALACMDCREKKIKCEPGVTSCLQCEKAKRVCRRKTSTNHHHDGSSTTEWSSNAGSPPATRPGAASDSVRPTSREAENANTQKRRAQDELVVINNAIKRQKSVSPSTIHNSINLAVTNGAHPPLPTPRMLSDEADPYVVDHALTERLLNLYFMNINSGVYSLFPQDSFMKWVRTNSDKTQSDRMVLHAMMAMASVFDPHTFGGVGEHCAALANAALNAKFGKFSLQLIHIRLLLALYNFAKGSKGVAWEHCGAAMRAISALRFNNEEGCHVEPSDDPASLQEYGLTHYQAVECRRRTFWCGFMMDRFNGFCEGMLCTVDKADVYLRLPCAETAFEKGARSQAPFFDNGIVERAEAVLTSSAPVALMAHLALVTSIWSDVMNFVYRGMHRSSSGHAAAYEIFYAETYRALEAWRSRLPAHLDYNEQNLGRAVCDGYAGDFVTMHILYHYALLKLNRCMRWSLMTNNVPRNIGQAHTNAHQLLGIIRALNASKGNFDNARGYRYAFSTPFIGFAIVSAIDVISAGGLDSKLKPTIESMREGLAFLREMTPFWSSASDQARAGEKRFLQLNNVVVRPYKAASGCWLGRKWGLEDPIEKEVDMKDDCIYGVEHNIYFEALERLAREPQG